MKRIWTTLLALLLVSLACNWQPALPGLPTRPADVEPGTPTQPEANPSPAAPTATSALIRPTRSPTPTPVPIPSRTPVTPTKTLPAPPEGNPILIEYFDKYGGEPEWKPSDAYIGRHLPRLVVYTDGQLIWRDDAGALLEGILSEEATCTLLNGMQKFGFFKLAGDGSLEADDPIYSKIPEKYLDDVGSTSFLLVVNGNPAKWMVIYRPFVDSLVPPAKSTWEIFNSYRPSDLQDYQAEVYAVWIEYGQKLARTYGAGEDLVPADWPRDLVTLDNLLGDQELAQIFLDAEDADLLLKFYTPAPGVKVFKENRDLYSVMLRPLLPHERLNNLSPVPLSAQSFGLPFKCPK